MVPVAGTIVIGVSADGRHEVVRMNRPGFAGGSDP
jgi:hypothetical protein